MKNKILINLYIPSIECRYEIFIPANETIKKVIDLIIKSVNELSDDSLPLNNMYNLLDPETTGIYNNSSIVRDTNIINDKRIILV